MYRNYSYRSYSQCIHKVFVAMATDGSPLLLSPVPSGWLSRWAAGFGAAAAATCSVYYDVCSEGSWRRDEVLFLYGIVEHVFGRISTTISHLISGPNSD